MKSIVFTGVARRAWRHLPDDVQQALRAALRRYLETGHGDVIAMRGRATARLRWGDYRVVFLQTPETLEIHAVGHRKDVYT